MKHAVALVPGDVLEAPYPFVRDTYWAPPDSPEDPGGEVASWKPGVRAVAVLPDDSELYADAMGAIILTVVSVHRPGRYAERVFYTRKWRDPDGRTFGKNGCRMTTVAAFRRLARGYRHPFAIAPHPSNAT